jgi:hypothetical protein
MIPCPSHPEEESEQLFLGRLRLEAAKNFFAHIERCQNCRKAYDETVALVRLIRQETERLRPGFEVHAN